MSMPVHSSPPGKSAPGRSSSADNLPKRHSDELLSSEVTAGRRPRGSDTDRLRLDQGQYRVSSRAGSGCADGQAASPSPVVPWHQVRMGLFAPAAAGAMTRPVLSWATLLTSRVV
jgi:hypothetical protein